MASYGRNGLQWMRMSDTLRRSCARWGLLLQKVQTMTAHVEERLDCYLSLRSVDKDGVVRNELEWKLRCEGRLLEFTKEMDTLYKKFHPGSLSQPVRLVIDIEKERNLDISKIGVDKNENEPH